MKISLIYFKYQVFYSFKALSTNFLNFKNIKVIMSYLKLNWNATQFKSEIKLTNYETQYTELNMTQ
jgi:hypothetical protein